MKLKNLLYALIAPFVVSAFVSCSDIDENERLIEVQPEQTEGRKILIEDFTGQMCVNCPNATDLIGTFQEDYGHDTIIAVAIHSGPMSIPVGKKQSLATDEGNEYFNKWKPDSQPMGVINRKGGALNTNLWATKITEIMSTTTPVEMELTAEYDSEAKKINAHIKAYAIANVSGKLQLWITEDDITAMQSMPDGKPNKTYVHNHVFRSSVNGTWGEDITLNNVDTFEKDYTIDVKDEWKGENIHLVAFIYNDAEGVLQVVRSH